MNLKKSLRFAFAAAGIAWFSYLATPADASVVIGGTRVIYDAGESEVTLKLSNAGQTPALVQSWIDSGDVHGAPTGIKVPFIVTPPIARIDPSKAQTLRIVYTGEPMPADRESVFWLNVLEVPPKPKAEDADLNRIQLAFRSRIKLFYRPGKLKGSSADAPAQLTWRLTRAGGKPAIEANNPTPFHVSLTMISVQAGERSAVFDDGGMVGPGETRAFPLKGDVPEAAGASVHYTTLNDYGGAVNGTAPLQSGAAAPAP
ncbi:molecular chaperone EcpD [Burkholderia sp. MSh2]|uniref:Pilus assembly protein n=1 Tax=Burkholderia paludis TaxID=1506587 RepID=A0A6P2MCX6_9BURK|nr:MULTISPECIES: fimbria/pilus periplasmic chaperone [Burkholderia]KEZ06574.1 molecular chaperone EcpD [Burkholderia sp. MSh2]KFG95014.1 molecular chaperone EcpD [Burkholderia paludis]CAB3754430.1 putative fimbrial chaperone YadV [Burkholderia paludis]VWB76695.1 pilus assembly protein [Burkholderia paludis]